MREKFLLLRGDSLVLDRWRWLKKQLPKTQKNEKILDVGCGNGAFSIGLARRGYDVLGLTWDEKDKKNAEKIVDKLRLKNCKFEVQDVRYLDKRKEFLNNFDIIVCTENIEHIIDDKKLMKDMTNCLTPKGKIFLTTPNKSYIPISQGDAGPFRRIEDGNHVRKGYDEKDLRVLCKFAKTKCIKTEYCGGYLSQKITRIYRKIGKLNNKLAWIITLPLKILPLILDSFLTKKLKWQYYSICMVAQK